MTSINLTSPHQDRVDLVTNLQALTRDLTPDLTFVCKQGETVMSQMSLLQLSSPFIREIVDTLPSTSLSSVTIIIPEVSKMDMNEVVSLLTWEKEDWIVSSAQNEVISLLRIPVGFPEEIIVPREDDTLDITNNSITEANDPEGFTNDNLPPKCLDCEIVFEDCDSIEEIKLHVAEVHHESMLNSKHRNKFKKSSRCDQCGETLIGQYVQKEHIILEHPWKRLTTAVNTIVSNANAKKGKSLKGKLIETVENSCLTDDASVDNILGTEKQTKQRFTGPKSSEYTNIKKVVRHRNYSIEKVIPKPRHAGKSKLKCNLCDQVWNSSMKMDTLKSKIKMHIYFDHFGGKLDEVHKTNFKGGNKCHSCVDTNSVIRKVNNQKRHLITEHKILKHLTDPHVIATVASREETEPSTRHSNEVNYMHPSAKRLSEENSEISNKKAKQVTFDEYVIQSKLEFSDSEEE